MTGLNQRVCRPRPIAILLGAGVAAVSLVLLPHDGGAAAAGAAPPATPPPATPPRATPAPSPGGLRPAGVPATAAPSPPPQPANGIARAPAPGAGPMNDPVATGRTLYGQSCASCHGQDGGGSERGPALTGVGAAAADFWLSTGRMPEARPAYDPPGGDPVFDRAQIDALNAFVASLGEGPTIPVVAPGDLTRGQRLYQANCASCHSASGAGALLPGDRSVPDVTHTNATQVAEAIRLGPGSMPPFPPSTLPDTDVNAIVAYLESLHRVNDAGGTPLGTVGPVSEGLVGWVIGAAALVLVAGVLGTRAGRRSP